MSKPHQPDIVDVLAANIASPGIVADIDKALEDNERVRTDLLELRKWAVRRHGEPGVGAAELKVDLTLPALIAGYKSNPDSPYQGLRFKTRENYDSLLQRLGRDLGDVPVKAIDAESLERNYADWRGEENKVAIAHGLIGMLRMLATFGSTILKDQDCRALRVTLHDMKFEQVKPRSERLTAQHAKSIRDKARELGMPSIALAQAIQFECGLRQKDVIGEWVPVDEPGVSGITWQEFGKWLRGIRWQQIDENLILRHTTSKAQKEVMFELRHKPMVMEELQLQYCKLGESVTRDKLPAGGAVIVNENTGYPYVTHQFRRAWRLVADTADVPKTVKNMDSRVSARGESMETANAAQGAGGRG